MEEKTMTVQEITGEIQAALDSSAAALEVLPPMEAFTFRLKDLSGCASWVVNLVNLEYDKINVLAADADEAFPSKLKCIAEARERVARAFHEAEGKMAEHTRTPGEKSFYHSFQKHFDARLEALKEKLEALRTPENAAVVDEIEAYMTASRIHAKAKGISDALAGRYPLPELNRYYDKINYDSYDPSGSETGLGWLVGKAFIRHGYNCFDAIRAIEEDAVALLNRFQDDFNTQVQDEILAGIVEPVQALLPRLLAVTKLSA